MNFVVVESTQSSFEQMFLTRHGDILEGLIIHFQSAEYQEGAKEDKFREAAGKFIENIR